MNKKRLIIILLVLCVTLGMGETMAFFNADDTARNVITTGNIEIELIETDANGDPFVNASDVMPGSKVAKVVTVKNTADNSCWVRIDVDKEILLAEGKSGTTDLSLIRMDFNTEDWMEKDGCFYYKNILNPGETTEPLFTTVTFDTAMDNLYQGCTAAVKVDAQAVQSDNNGNSVLDANGWPEK